VTVIYCLLQLLSLGVLFRQNLRSGIQDLGNDRVNIRIHCAVIHDADAEAKSLLQLRVRKIDVPATHDTLEQCQVEKISRFFGCGIVHHVAETDRA